jgi:ribonucleoside-diphosphate reductase beta chain
MEKRLLVPKETYIVEYPEAVKFADTQLGIFWLPDEVKVEKDVQDILVNMTESERHGVITTLKLFTMYELIVGGEYWQNLVFKKFKRPADIQRMAKCFSFVELCVHAPFYSKINDALGLSSDAFYSEYLNDEVLKSRIETLEAGAKSKDLPTALAHLTITEGVILYSNFAFLKHFQSQGKNKLLNVVRGINFSARDENLHSEASAWLFRTMEQEGYFKREDIEQAVIDACLIAYEHECKIIDKIFEKGRIEGITDTQMKRFVESRINTVLANLGYKRLYEISYNPIAEWFYTAINGYISNDFFTGQGREYSRDWEEKGFVW